MLYNSKMSDIEQIVNQVKLATDYQVNKQILREKIRTELHLAYNNGLFYLDQSLLAFVATWPDAVLYLEDAYQNPIEVQRDEFLVLARERYHAVMNTWCQQHADLRKIRKV